MKLQNETITGFTVDKPTPKQEKAWRELVRRLTGVGKNTKVDLFLKK